LFIGATFAAMENHRTDSIPNDSYPVKSDRLLAGRSFENAETKNPGTRAPGFLADAVRLKDQKR
jgi:hypothetical protein